MRNDRQRGWLWLFGIVVGIALFVAGTWRLATFDQSWRAIVRVRMDANPASWTSPDFLQEKFKSASNTFTDAVFRLELERAAGLPMQEFRYLEACQYRGTSVIELKFAGRNEAEVKLLAEQAVHRWRERLMTNTPAHCSEFLEVLTLSSAQDQSNTVRRWRWRHFGF